MIWYKAGTVAVTNGSANVTGTSVDFIANAKIGDEFIGPDGKGYEITQITSSTTMVIDPPYLGTTQTGQSYKIKPTRGLTVEFVKAANALLAEIQPLQEGALQGKFQTGTVALPAISAVLDENTGISWPADDTLALSTNGVQRMLLGTTALTVDLPIVGTAVQTGPTDATAGRLMKTGAFGLGALTPPELLNLDDTTTRPGFYAVKLAAAGVFPNNDTPVEGFVIVARTSDVTMMQLLQPIATAILYRRIWRQATGFGAWERVSFDPAALAAVATTGAYNDLTGAPTLGTAAAQNVDAFATGAEGDLAVTAVQPSDLDNVAFSGAYADLSGLPSLDFLPLSGGSVTGNINLLGTGLLNFWNAGKTVKEGSVYHSDAHEAVYIAAWDSAGANSLYYKFDNSTGIMSSNESVVRRLDGDSRYLQLAGGTLTGDLGVGTSNPVVGVGNSDLGIYVNTRYIAASRSGAAALLINRATSNGPIQQFYRDGTQEGSISVTTTATSYNTTSDERLKTNFAEAGDAGAILDQIDVLAFDRIENGEHFPFGFVAQQLYEAFPEAVTPGGEDPTTDPWQVDNSKLVPVLVKEIQSLRRRIEELEASQS